MATFRLAASLGAIALAAAALLGSAAASAGIDIPGKGVLPPKNPAHNVSSEPDFLTARSCAGGRDSAACNSIVVRAIANARKELEKLGGMSFSLAAYQK